MAFVTRPSFARGWVPDADAVNGPVDGLLRADNLTLDELGVPGVRQGSTTLYTGLSGSDVHSLYTAILSGTRYRMAGVGDAVFANGVSLVTSLAGANDVAFGSHLGQILLARGTTTRKYDGTTVRKWGLAMTGAKATVAAVAPDAKVFASCDSSESPAFTVEEDDGSGPTFSTGQAGAANGSIVVHPNASSGRGTISKRFAADVDFTSYAGGTTGADSDLITLYIYVTEPANLLAVDIAIDVNGASTNPFQNDYYFGSFQMTADQALTQPAADLLSGNYAAQGAARRVVVAQADVVGVAVSRLRNDKPVSNAGWSKLAIPRGQMHRVGATAGKDWKTVIGIRVIVTTSTPTPVRLDQIQIEAARLLGAYKWTYCLAYNTGVYVALSAPAPYSDELTLQTQAVTLTVPADTLRDSQANEIWVFRMGGVLNAFFRTKVQTGVSGTGAVTITDPLADVDALVVNITLETDNAIPPANIIDIEGPYYDRTMVLTADGFLWPSRRLNPDSFGTGQAIRVAAPDEQAYWVKKAFGGLYIGTSKDIYRLTGTGAELPDGSIDFDKEPLNIDHPPTSNGLAHDGNLLLYVSDDGWRAMSGQASTSLVADTSLLYRGQTRHGIAPVNLTGGRFRAAIGKGQLLAITPEGTDTDRSATIYRHVPLRGAWYRDTYPQAFRSLVREPDGTVLAGDAGGVVWILDSGTTDGGVAIPIVLWTKADDLGDAFHDKALADVHLRGETGGLTYAAAVHINNAAGASGSATFVTPAGADIAVSDLVDLPACRQIQLRIAGSGPTFKLTAIGFTYRPLPVAVLAWDSGPVDLGGPELVWLRAVRIKAFASGPLVVASSFDGVAVESETVVPSLLNQPTHVTAWLGKGVKGRVGRVTIRSATPFRPYWIEFIRRATGRVTDKGTVRVSAEGAV